MATWSAMLNRRFSALESATASTQTVVAVASSGDSGSASGTSPTDLTDYLLWPEKPGYASAWTQAQADKTTLDTQADQAGVSRVAYDNAYTTLSNYLTDQPGSIYAVGGTNYPMAGWNTLDRIDKYLGPGGRANWNSKWNTYLIEAQKLRDAISNAGLTLGLQSDVIRPLLIWDFFGTNLPTQAAAGNGYNPPNVGPTNVTATSGGAPTDGDDHTYSNFAPGGVVAQKHNFPTQSVIFQTAYLGVYGATPAIYPSGMAVRDGYLVVIKCRWHKVAGAGSWVGKVTPTVSTGGTLPPIVVAAPTENQWRTLVWDLRGTSFNAGVNLTGFLTELVDGGSIDMDFAILGSYGGGSRVDYDNLVSQQATLSMMRADFVNPATGKIAANVHIDDNSVTAPLIVAEQAFFKLLTVGNYDNLVVNGNSQYIPNPDWVSCGGSNAGIAGIRVYTGAAGTGFANSTRCRRLTNETVVITDPTPVAVGEVYALYCFMDSEAGATGTISVESSADGVTGWSAITLGAGASGNAIGWNDAANPPLGNPIGNSFTVPSGGGFIRVSLTCTGLTAVRFDNIYLRKCADSRLIVDGGILTRHLSAGAVQAWQANFGPNYQFFSRATGGNPLFQTTDGALKRPANTTEWNPITENLTDPVWYADPNRVYPSNTTIWASRFEATFYGVSSTTAPRSVIAALDSPFTPTTGAELRRTGTGIQLFKVTGIATSTAIGTETSVTDPGTNYEKVSLVLYNPTGTGATELRAEAFINGKSVKKWTRADVDTTFGIGGAVAWNSGSGFYTGVKLGSTGLKMTGISMGGGNVTIESGIVTADMLVALLALVGKIQSQNFTQSTVTPTAPVGFMINGQTFTTYFLDGTTSVNCVAEFGGDLNINGRKASTMTDRVFDQWNRLQNPRFYGNYIAGDTDTTLGSSVPWTTATGTKPTIDPSSTSYSASFIGHRLGLYSATSVGTVSKYGGFTTDFLRPVLPGGTVNLKFKIICDLGSGPPTNPQGTIVVKLTKPDATVTTLGTFVYGTDFTAGATSKTINVTSNLTQSGSYLLRFEVGSYVEFNTGTAAANSLAVTIAELDLSI